jgi:branched-chain amino acid transport system substrate-binding protein
MNIHSTQETTGGHAMRTTRRTLLIGASTAAFATTAGRVAFAKDPIKIGVPTALTGPYAQLGDEAKRAIEFAIGEANAAGGIDGRKVEVRYLDTEAKPELARQQGEKLALAGYNLLTGTIASGEALAMGPMLGRWNAIYVSTINKADDITGKQCQPRMFRVNRPDNSDAAVVQPWLATRAEKKWAIMAADIAWGRNSGASFRKAADATGKTIVSENYPAFGSNDYAAHIQKVADSGAEAMWVALAGRDAINFAKQAKQFGLFDKVVTGGTSFTTDGTVKVLGDVVKGVHTIINYSATLDTPGNKKLVADWAVKYPGTQPTNFEGETYLGMQVIFQAVKKAGSIRPADVAKALEGGTFETILGTQTMRKEDHQLVGPNYFGSVQMHNGILRPVINMTVPADVATPRPDGSCKL